MMQSVSAEPADLNKTFSGLSLQQAAYVCLMTGQPELKCRLTFALSTLWRERKIALRTAVPTEPEAVPGPGKPERPRLVEARNLARRGVGTQQGRAAFLHAIAHIEFNAINLAWDAVYRFDGMPDEYYSDFVATADDEARHFLMLQKRLAEIGVSYGDFDAHNGLWEMAEKTAHSCLERMALVPRVLEARGLDVTPHMIEKLRHEGDTESVEILQTILKEEVAHVAAGTRWFNYLCAQQGHEPKATFLALVRRFAAHVVRPPFNVSARSRAGFDAIEMAKLMELFEQQSAPQALKFTDDTKH